jgi:hypothetical protein
MLGVMKRLKAGSTSSPTKGALGELVSVNAQVANSHGLDQLIEPAVKIRYFVQNILFFSDPPRLISFLVIALMLFLAHIFIGIISSRWNELISRSEI